jgi:DNA-binding NarL/FixJ family response regulator
MTAIRVALADDHAVVRTGIRAMLESLGGIEVVGEATTGHEAIALVEQQRPQVLLMDISMPEMNGLDATSRIVKAFPEVRVIIVSMHTSEEYVWQALRAGAAGYLLKDTDATELDSAIKSVLAGQSYLTAAVSQQKVENYMQRLGSDTDALAILTPRQREILQGIAEGKSTKQIAATLAISAKTVETHRSALMERLAIYDIPGLVRFAMRSGLVPPEK